MRKWKQRLWSLLLCGALVASLCPTALAENVSISYLDENGEVQSCETYITVTPTDIGWNTDKNPSGWYVAENSVEIEYSVNVRGTVRLILANGCDLKVIGGIEVGIGNSLTIYAQSDGEAMGKLTATSSRNAGIGGGGNITINGGTITINGGTVEASSTSGAGIGGGRGGAGGSITINGGTVTATSIRTGAGIGGGQNGGGEITISGGTVEATGGSAEVAGSDGAGIGGGVGGAGGKITISGGTVTATSKGKGADIGDGYDYNTGGIAPSEKIEISEGADVKGSGGGKPNLGPPHGATTDKWVYDSTGHWHPCEVESCAEQFDKDAHSFGDWITGQEPTDTTPGSKYRECGICQYQQTGTIPPIEPPDPVDPPDPEPPDPVDPDPPKPVDPPSGGDSYTPPTYRPDVPKPSEGGTVSVTPSRPERGDTVTVKPRPDEGYELDSITVTDRKGENVEVTAKPDGTYTFKQPAGRVKIEVTYKPVETPWSNPFADVSESAWYYEAVRFVQEQGLMSGYSDGRFAPEDTLSRSQLAQILFNKEGRPVVNYLLQYGDVAGEAWYTEAVRWAASQGIVGGYGDGTFGPNDPITREQLAVMLWRYSGSPAANQELYFRDESEISGYALEALRWAVENGILNGGGGRLGPQDQATRAQVAQMLKNFIENQEEDS